MMRIKLLKKSIFSFKLSLSASSGLTLAKLKSKIYFFMSECNNFMLFDFKIKEFRGFF